MRIGVRSCFHKGRQEEVHVLTIGKIRKPLAPLIHPLLDGRAGFP